MRDLLANQRIQFHHVLQPRTDRCAQQLNRVLVGLVQLLLSLLALLRMVLGVQAEVAFVFFLRFGLVKRGVYRGLVATAHVAAVAATGRVQAVGQVQIEEAGLQAADRIGR